MSWYIHKYIDLDLFIYIYIYELRSIYSKLSRYILIYTYIYMSYEHNLIYIYILRSIYICIQGVPKNVYTLKII